MEPSSGLLDPITEYNVYRNDGQGKRSGSVCAFMKKNIRVLPVDLTEKYANLDTVCVDFVNSKSNVRRYCV